MAIRVAKALQDYIADKIFVELQPNTSADAECCAVLRAVQFKIIILRVWGFGFLDKDSVTIFTD